MFPNLRISGGCFTTVSLAARCNLEEETGKWQEGNKDEGERHGRNSEVLEVCAAVTKKSAIFWDVTSCGSCENRRFG
jgi:hypothetical protein